MKIVLFGPFDRYNYGDILFPAILSRHFSKVLDAPSILYAGQVAADFTSVGGYRVRPVGSYLRTYDELNIVHVGGEVLGCDTKTAILMNLPQPVADVINRAIVSPEWSDFLDKSAGAPLGYVCRPGLKSHRTYFNSVGGSSIDILDQKRKEFLAAALKSATYISVRDSRTQEILQQQFGISAVCAPDCAVLMKEYFEVETKIPLGRVGDFFLKPQEYLVFQCNLAYFQKTKGQLEEELIRIYRHYHMPLVLLPIGTDAFHEDDASLERIQASLIEAKVPCALVSDRHIVTVMKVIRHAKAIVCTSLHGRITALAFSVPRVTLNSGDRKQPAYIETWEEKIASFSIIDDMAISDALQKSLDVPKDVYEEISKDSFIKSLKSINEITESIRSVSEETSHNALFLEDGNWSNEPISPDYILRAERDRLVVERDGLAAERDRMLNSRSWRITQPLRDLAVQARRFKMWWGGGMHE